MYQLKMHRKQFFQLAIIHPNFETPPMSTEPSVASLKRSEVIKFLSWSNEAFRGNKAEHRSVKVSRKSLHNWLPLKRWKECIILVLKFLVLSLYLPNRTTRVGLNRDRATYFVTNKNEDLFSALCKISQLSLSPLSPKIFALPILPDDSEIGREARAREIEQRPSHLLCHL